MNPVINNIFAYLQRFHIRFGWSLVIATVLHVFLALALSFGITLPHEKKVELKEIHVKLGMLQAPKTKIKSADKPRSASTASSSAVAPTLPKPAPEPKAEAKPTPPPMAKPEPQPAPKPIAKEAPNPAPITPPLPTQTPASMLSHQEMADLAPTKAPELPKEEEKKEVKKSEPASPPVKELNLPKPPVSEPAPTPPMAAQDAPSSMPSDTATPSLGHEFGNRAEADETISQNYRQLLSLWMEKHKIYPPVAVQQKLQGKGIIQIHVKRNGEIYEYRIEQSTGYDMLDDAIIDMVRRANPVPPIPIAEKSDIFRIPITFHLE